MNVVSPNCSLSIHQARLLKITFAAHVHETGPYPVLLATMILIGPFSIRGSVLEAGPLSFFLDIILLRHAHTFHFVVYSFHFTYTRCDSLRFANEPLRLQLRVITISTYYSVAMVRFHRLCYMYKFRNALDRGMDFHGKPVMGRAL